jgi:hypothetical protein
MGTFHTRTILGSKGYVEKDDNMTITSFIVIARCLWLRRVWGSLMISTDDLTPPPDDPPTVPAPIPTFSSAQDQVMEDTTSGSGPIPKTRGASAKEKGKSKD